jgi:hypothetical protein
VRSERQSSSKHRHRLWRPIIFVEEVGFSGQWIVEVGWVYGATLIEVAGERGVEWTVRTSNGIADRRANAVLLRVFVMEGGVVHHLHTVGL